MAFIGAIDKDSRIGVGQVLSTLSPTENPDIYVGCSGNFTFDRMAAVSGFKVHSNDVSLYSRNTDSRKRVPVNVVRQLFQPLDQFSVLDDFPKTIFR
jgi:hypothetical protein